MTKPADILIVDDEKNIRSSLRGILEDEKYTVEDVESGEKAVEAVKKNYYRVIFLDVLLPGIDGIDTLKQIKSASPESIVLMMSGHATVDMAVEATRHGAYSFFEKPLGPEKILHELKLLKAQKTIKSEVEALRKQADYGEMIGNSQRLQELKRIIARISPTDGRVLITGDNGTGKELVARAIHYSSKRKEKPFVKINCAALPKELIESELFGYEKGAFTGATTRKIGQIEQAHTGTLFLDEIGDMSLDTQAKLLRVLEENELVRLGGTKPIAFDVRIISATNQNIEKNIDEGKFREDLYHRLCVIPVRVPRLSERLEDIEALTVHFAVKYAENTHSKRELIFNKDALQLLKNQPWTGNIRELRNLIERISILHDSEEVSAENLRQYFSFGSVSGKTSAGMSVPEPNGRSMREMINTLEKELITREYERCNGNVSKVAKNLKIDRANLHRKLKALGIK